VILRLVIRELILWQVCLEEEDGVGYHVHLQDINNMKNEYGEFIVEEERRQSLPSIWRTWIHEDMLKNKLSRDDLWRSNPQVVASTIKNGVPS
jgi:hypothetical protein